MLAVHTRPMAIDERGRWRADSDEPFNAGLGGFDPQRIRDSMEPGADGCALSGLWAIAVVSVVLGVVGPSLFLGVVGAALMLPSLRWTIRRSRRERRRVN